MKLPDFLIIGAQKCGTTSLFNYLKQHPEVSLPEQKEIHYFDKQYHKNTNWYSSNFPNGTQITGEATPYYFYHPHVPGRIAKLCPTVKLIVLLRNPVERAYSHFMMEKQRNREPLGTFEEAINAEPGRLKEEKDILAHNPFYISPAHQRHSYLDRGKYYTQISNWLKYFSLENFLFIKSELFFENTANVLGDVFQFLGLKNERIPDLKKKKKNNYPPLKEETRLHLIEYFSRENRSLVEIIGTQFFW